MTRTKMLAALLVIAAVFSAQQGAQSQTSTGTHAHKKTKTKKVVVKKETATEAQVRELREKLDEQQTQIDLLKTKVSSDDTAAATAQQSAADAQSQAAQAAATAAAANSAATSANATATSASSSVTALQGVDAGLQATMISNQTAIQEEIDSPTVLHYKGLNITPVGFFALEGVWRQHSVNSDINTPFNSIPFPSANEGHVSELNFSGRQSRLGALFEGNAGTYKLSGYFEADFLGTGTSSNNNQSDSYVLRQRQIWGQAATKSGFTVTGGQMWSLVTEDGRSTDNRTEKLPNTIDPQYMVGFSWTRQPGLRLQQRFGDPKLHALTLAMSIEQAQITNFTVASSTSGAVPADFSFAGSGQNGGLYNAAGNAALSGPITTYANNVAPDVIAKAAYDLHKAHIEVGGLARFLRDYYFPIATATVTSGVDAYTYSTHEFSNTKAVGGFFGSVRVSPVKFFDVAVQGMAGQGLGRYGSSQLADATLRPDETLEPIRNYHGLFSLETHPAPKLDVYAYYGGEYAQRTLYTTQLGAVIGYGSPTLSDTGCYNLPSAGGGTGTGGSISATGCASPTKYIQEGMMGFTYRVVNSPRYGRLQYQMTYSYLQRQLWGGIGSASTPTSPRAEDNMIHAGMRYYIP